MKGTLTCFTDLSEVRWLVVSLSVLSHHRTNLDRLTARVMAAVLSTFPLSLGQKDTFWKFIVFCFYLKM